jgi:hypothetical protein
LLAAVAALVAPIVGVGSPAGAKPPQTFSGFGPNVTIFDDTMSTSHIEDTINDIWEQQRNNEMGTDRYSLLFKPGEYGTSADPLQVAVGYYTEVAGLGGSPEDVQINGKIEVFNRCFDASGDPADEGDPDVVECFALNNFWHSISNLTINVNGAGQAGCEASSNFWAVSQAVSGGKSSTTAMAGSTESEQFYDEDSSRAVG